MSEFLLSLRDFHFIRPLWLLGLLPLFLVWFMHRKGQSSEHIDALVDKHLQVAVVAPAEPGGVKSASGLVLLLMALLSFALAGPSWQRLPQPLHQLVQGRVLVLSLSESMDRTDMLPSRLSRAKFKLVDLLASMPGMQNGLIGFAGAAFMVAPLSDDQDTITNLLQSLDSKTMPVQGIRADLGLQKAAQILSQVEIDLGEVILVADQASPLAISEAAKLANAGVRVSVLEIAPAEGSDQRDLFTSIAQAGGGVYTRLRADDRDIITLNQFMRGIATRANAKTKQSQHQADQWRDAGPYLLIPILLLGSLLFRRGWLVFALPIFLPIAGWLMVGLVFSRPVNAFELERLWQREDQVQWQAAKAYREEDYREALAGFERDTSATGFYNQGNALARIERFQEAIAAYDKALALKPEFEDANYNRELVVAALEERQQEAGEEAPEPEPGTGDQEGEGDESEGSGDESVDQNAQGKEEGQSSEGQASEQSDDLSGQAQEQTMDMQASEDEQTLEMMLRQVPDDPGILLRRKFAKQYSNRLRKRQTK